MRGVLEYLTYNEYGAIVVLSLEEYVSLTDNIERKLNEADRQSAITEESLSHETVFCHAKSTKLYITKLRT